MDEMKKFDMRHLVFNLLIIVLSSDKPCVLSCPTVQMFHCLSNFKGSVRPAISKGFISNVLIFFKRNFENLLIHLGAWIGLKVVQPNCGLRGSHFDSHTEQLRLLQVGLLSVQCLMLP